MRFTSTWYGIHTACQIHLGDLSGTRQIQGVFGFRKYEIENYWN